MSELNQQSKSISTLLNGQKLIHINGEDLIEQEGVLFKFLCKPGDVLYYPDEEDDYVFPVTIDKIIVSGLGNGQHFVRYEAYSVSGNGDIEREFDFMEEDFGSIVFKTQAEAETYIKKYTKSELTKEQTIVKHRKMWHWIADETEKRKQLVCKEDYMQENERYKKHIRCDCYCCEYSNQQYNKATSKEALSKAVSGEDIPNSICDYCPIDWDSKYPNAMCMDRVEMEDGYFCKWMDTDDWETAVKYARIIAELPEKFI